MTLKYNLAIISDGSDEGGSDVYASDAEKYENLEEFDFDHQVT